MNTSPTTWTHKGLTIEFDAARAVFSAWTGSKRLTGGSLDAIKKKIDAAKKFEAFPVYIELTGWEANRYKESKTSQPVLYLNGSHTGARALIEADVIELQKDGKGRHSRGQWNVRYKNEKGSDNTKMEWTVLPRTPEAMAAWKALWEAKEAADAAEHNLKEANKEKLSPLHDAVPYRRASEES